MENKLRISFDIGGVLSKYPDTFRKLVNVLLASPDVEVFVLTDIHDHEKSVRMVQDNGFNVPSERILNSDYDTHGEACKAEVIKQYEIEIHIDDFPGYCDHNECINLFVWPNQEKSYYHDDWKTDGTEGNFGRRKSSKNE